MTGFAYIAQYTYIRTHAVDIHTQKIDFFFVAAVSATAVLQQSILCSFLMLLSSINFKYIMNEYIVYALKLISWLE